MPRHPVKTDKTTDRKSYFQREAFQYMEELYRSALRLTGKEAAAEDLVSDTYARAWKSFSQFTSGTNLRAWLFKILMSIFINQYRSQQRRPAMVELDRPRDPEEEGASLYDRLQDAVSSPTENPERFLSTRILDTDLKRAIENLPEDFRAAVVLCDMQHFSYEDISRMLEIPIGTVRSRIFRGRQILQQKLWKHAVEMGLTPESPAEPR